MVLWKRWPFLCLNNYEQSLHGFGTKQFYFRFNYAWRMEKNMDRTTDSKEIGVYKDEIKEQIDNFNKVHGVKNSNQNENESLYGTAIIVSWLMSFIGWISFAVGLLIVIVGVSSLGTKPWPYNNALLILGASLVLSGLFLVASAQVTRAVVDTADNTRKIFEYLKKTD